ncbi:MAG: hypothetical protein IPI30_12325 [Saprospiraceae bacterium]|nr:hypothetical protein [Candidatus Vicinibacter affinis]
MQEILCVGKDFDTFNNSTSDILDSKPASWFGFANYPTKTSGSLVIVNYEDHVFPSIVNGNDACYEVLRKVSLINWCRFYIILTEI